MICKKCGSDEVVKEGEHYVCKSCGAIAVAADNAEELKKIKQQQEAAADKADNGKKKDKPKKSPLREVVDFMLPIVLALVVAMLLKSFVFANAQVPSGSMLNTIQLGDRIIASRLEYKFHDPERGDIIIFKAPDDVEEHEKNPDAEVRYFVKRLIGLPGETVTIVNGVVYIQKPDGTQLQLDEPYITACDPYGDFGPYEVPEGHYLMLGDNRNDSADARYWRNTYLDEDLIVGKVKFRYLPKFSTFEQPDYGESDTAQE